MDWGGYLILCVRSLWNSGEYFPFVVKTICNYSCLSGGWDVSIYERYDLKIRMSWATLHTRSTQRSTFSGVSFNLHVCNRMNPSDHSRRKACSCITHTQTQGPYGFRNCSTRPTRTIYIYTYPMYPQQSCCEYPCSLHWNLLHITLFRRIHSSYTHRTTK